MPFDIDELVDRAREYVELEASTKVLKIAFEESFTLFGREDVVLSVLTKDKDDPEWWVIGGATPMNLYSKKKYSSADEAFSLHSGLMLRLADRNFEESQDEPHTVGYDAFISHASEDKNDLVRPLAHELEGMGFKIWYDEFELIIGDSLRQSIDKGLVNSRYGIVILSPSFLEKRWPGYELNGLLAREINGSKVILPVWHNISKSEILKYSPSLADKVALVTEGKPVVELASRLAEVLTR